MKPCQEVTSSPRESVCTERDVKGLGQNPEDHPQLGERHKKGLQRRPVGGVRPLFWP